MVSAPRMNADHLSGRGEHTRQPRPPPRCRRTGKSHPTAPWLPPDDPEARSRRRAEADQIELSRMPTTASGEDGAR
jgi:hypothetical protein